MDVDYDSFDWGSWTPTEEATLLFAFDGAERVLLIHKANAACLLGLDEQNRQTTERQREEK